MTEFILAITEFYALNTDGFAHLMQMAISSGLVRWRILCILLYLLHAMNPDARGRFSSGVPMEALAMSFICMRIEKKITFISMASHLASL